LKNLKIKFFKYKSQSLFSIVVARPERTINNKYFHSYATGSIKLFKTNSLSDQIISRIQSIVTVFRLVILFRF